MKKLITSLSILLFTTSMSFSQSYPKPSEIKPGIVPGDPLNAPAICSEYTMFKETFLTPKNMTTKFIGIIQPNVWIQLFSNEETNFWTSVMMRKTNLGLFACVNSSGFDYKLINSPTDPPTDSLNESQNDSKPKESKPNDSKRKKQIDL